MEKTMKARVQHKHDIEANWLKATNFTPLTSEIIVYDPDENYDYPRIKIGDGKTNINILPFITKDYAKEQWVRDLVDDSVTSLIVTYDTKAKKASHTAVEIKEHYNLGRNVVLCVNNEYLPIHLIFDSYVVFRNIVVAVNAIACYNYEVNDYGYVSESNDTIVSDVRSVNGKTGVVSLTASDVGALPSSTTIPTKTSQLTNDSGFINSYTETDPTVPAWAKAEKKPTYTAGEVGALPDSTKIPSKLSDLSEDANHRLVTDTEKATWNAKSNFSGSYDDLTDKPAIPSIAGLASTTYVDEAVKNKVDKDGNKVLSTNDYTTAEKNKLANIAAGAEVNVNADWNATSGDAQILNKPTLGSMAAKNSVAKSDLASAVQTSLGKADSALQPSDISDWAKATAKPTYTASEVGALPDSTKIPSKLGDLDNDKKYITAAEVPDEIYVGDGTMPNTATIQFIMDASDEEALLKDELQEYINTEIEAAKTKLELDIPSKTSQLTNDSGFITAKDIPEVQVPDLSDYAKTKDIPTKTSQLTNDSGFITQHQGLAGYAKTSDIPTKVSQLTNDSGFITAKDVPEAQVPDLSGYALKSSAETWTFTLSDGSKVTKKVVLA